MHFAWYTFVLALVASAEPQIGGSDTVKRVGSRVIATKYGSIRGVLVTLPNKNIGQVEVFLGIPYASPPVGQMRFMPPANPSQWRGVRSADRYGPVCPQRFPDIRNETESLRHMPSERLNYLKLLMPFLRNESEDCLYLNVFCPENKGNARIPVIVFLHGDSYEWSTGNAYDSTILSGFGKIIVVTLNYRLGILGFLPAMEAASRGNYGLLDIITALHWVQENIAQFGGDPRNITLFGHGYGASCAHLLMLSPMSKGLFQRVVLQSGSAFSPWALANEAMTFARHVARKLACPVLNHPALVRCMRLRPITEIMRVQLLIPEHLTAFGPMVDGIVIPEDPEKLFLNASEHIDKGPKVDILIGFTRVEAFFYFSATEERYGIEADRRDRILRTLVRNLYTFHLQEIFLTIVNEYTEWTRPVQHPINILDGTVEALTDALFIAPSVSSANLLSKLRHRIYLYVFNHPTEASDYPRLVCVHGDDIPYIFGAPLAPNLGHFPSNFTRQEVALSEAMMIYWSNFAKYGDPNVVHDVDAPEKTRSRFERFVWPLYDSNEQQFLSLSPKPKVKNHYHAHKLSFWLSLIPKLHRQGTTPGIASQHHLLEDHDNPATYDGIVRQGPVLPIGVPARIPSTQLRVNFDRPTISSGAEISVPHVSDTSSTFYSASRDDDIPQTPVPSSTNVSNSLASSESALYNFFDDYNALKVIVAVGGLFLLINIAIFAFVYRQKIEKCLKPNQEEDLRDSDLENGPATIKPHIRAPPPSPDLQRSMDLQQFIPPPSIFRPSGSPTSTPSMIPLEELQTRSDTEAHHTGTSKVRWAPDVGYEADRDAVWL